MWEAELSRSQHPSLVRGVHNLSVSEEKHRGSWRGTRLLGNIATALGSEILVSNSPLVAQKSLYVVT